MREASSYQDTVAEQEAEFAVITQRVLAFIRRQGELGVTNREFERHCRTYRMPALFGCDAVLAKLAASGCIVQKAILNSNRPRVAWVAGTTDGDVKP